MIHQGICGGGTQSGETICIRLSLGEQVHGQMFPWSCALLPVKESATKLHCTQSLMSLVRKYL